MKKLLIGLLMVFVVLGVAPHRTDAEEAVQIKINGELRNFSPGGKLVSGRTMLPVRYIVEDPAVGGEALWDPNGRKVTINCADNQFVFVIDSCKAQFNGREVTLDVAPFIYQGRTFLPLRFFAEQIGATVGWKARQNMVLINFGQSPRVMGYFYYGTPEELDHPSLTDVIFRWLETDGEGNLFYEYWNDAGGAARRQAALDRARQNGLKTHASVMLMGWDAAGRDKLHSLLSDPQNRQRLIANLTAHALQFGYDGINIDLEGIPAEDRDNFSRFMKELAGALRAHDLTLSAAAPAKVAGSSWHAGFDYTAVGQAVDYLIIMAYDYSTSKPGPSAPIYWLEDATRYALSCVPREKVILGIGTYGRDWNLDRGTRTTFYQSSLDNLLKSPYPQAWGFDLNSYTPYIDYQDQNGRQHRVWYENNVSLGEKYAVSVENNLPGISFWRLTGAFNDFFRVLGE